MTYISTLPNIENNECSKITLTISRTNKNFQSRKSCKLEAMYGLKCTRTCTLFIHVGYYCNTCTCTCKHKKLKELNIHVHVHVDS